MRIEFAESTHAPLELAPGTPLADALDGPQSPVFFGCKSGSCGTCLVEINEEGYLKLPPPSEEERDLLEAFAPDKKFVRLACLLAPETDLRLRFSGN